MAKKGGYYAVQSGRQEGVYSNWNDCKSQVNGYSGATYKRFDTYAEAQAFSNSSGGYSGSALSSSNTSYGTSGGSGSRSSSSSYSESYSTPSYDPIPTYSTPSFSSASKRAPAGKVEKYYSVKSNNPDISSKLFTNWDECKEYVNGQRGLSFKKFDDKVSATSFMKGDTSQVDYDHIGMNSNTFKSTYQIPRPSTSTKYSEKSNIYCDGSALSNGTLSPRAGYGVYFPNEPEKNISARVKSGNQTNNRAEMLAVSEALNTVWTNLSVEGKKVNYQIKTDSEYTAKLLNDRYGSYSKEELKDLPNGDLVVPLVEKFAQVKQYYEVNKDLFDNGGDFKIEWVKGHAGEPGNEIADELARQGASKD
ncbi:hypothetical protein NCAS_0C00850 [Naumovozyma castellii]|uniref:Ribonuclease H n=1 Tax=Naumovozyma castellii TaxID=27288 RepID=G0VC66_NAUCA|nr:hypothetical protein NCAS_0C00850 [Naumovozyma castellii CBS 4309]CCC69075.1 hypothetical protein NCAS_0C00850 [Naumovozyma castellii CBS 4309]